MSVERLEAEIIVTANTKQAETELTRLKSPIALKMAVDLGELRRQLSVVQGQIRNAQKSGDLTAEIKFRGNAEILKKEITKANRELLNFTRTGNKDVSVLGNLFTQLGDKIGLVNPRLGQLTSTLRGITASGGAVTGVLALVGGITALGVALGKSIKTAIGFESAFTGVQKTVNLSAEEYEILRNQLVNLTKTIPIAFDQLAKIAEISGQLGVAASDIAGFTAVVAKLGVTTNLSTEEAAFALARLQNFFDLTVDDVGRVGATIVSLGNNFATTEKDIVSFTERIGGTAALVGLTVDETLALAAAFSSVGIEAEAGGTAVNQLLLELQTATNVGGPALERFARVAGVTSDEFKKGFGEDAGATLQKFFQGLTDGGKEAGQILTELGIVGAREQRAFLTLAAAGGELERALTLANKAFSDNNALNQEAAKRFETTESQIQLFKNRMAALGDEIGQNFLPAIKATLKFIGDLATGVFGLGIVFTTFGKLAGLTLAALVETSKTVFSSIVNQVSRAFGIMKNIAFTGAKLIGEAFKFIPFGVQGAVNVAIGAIESLINGALRGVNVLIKGISKIPGLGDIGEIGNISLGRVEKVSPPDFTAVLKGFSDVNKEIAEGFDDRNETIKDRQGILSTTYKESLDDVIKQSRSQLEKLAGVETRALESTQKGLKNTLIKEQSDLLKELDSLDKKKGGSKAQEDQEKKRVEVKKESLETIKKILDEEAKAQKKNIDETSKQIKTLEDGLKKLIDLDKQIKELGNDTGGDVASRFVEIEQSIRDVNKDISEFDFNNGDIADYNALQSELIKLQEEKALAIANTTEEQRKEAERQSNLSDTAKILEEAAIRKADLEAKKLEIETELGFTQAAALEKVAILQAEKLESEEILLAYETAVTQAEESITAITKTNTDQRIVEYNKEMQKLRELIALQARAGVSGGGASGANSTTNTVNNSPTVIVNASVASGVDVNNLANELSKKITLSQKGINS